MNNNFKILYVVFAIMSSWLGIIFFNLSSTDSALLVQKLFKEPTIILFIILLLLYFINKKVIHMSKSLRFIYIYIFIILLSIVFSLIVFHSNLFQAIRSFKDFTIFAFLILVGYYFYRQNDIRRIAIILIFFALIILIFELIKTPQVFWKEVGFLELFLSSQDMIVDNSSKFTGFLNNDSIDNMYSNYDAINPITRYGTLTGSPIESGHVLGWVSVLVFFSIKKYFSFTSLLFLLSLFVGIISKTKGYMFEVVFVLMYFSSLKYPKIKIPIYILLVGAMSLFLYLYFESSIGHLFALFSGFTSLVDHPFGIGAGNAGFEYEDSFLGRIIVEFGIIGIFIYCTFFYKLYFYKQMNCNEESFQYKSIVFGLFVTSLLSGSSMHFVSLILPFLYLGVKMKYFDRLNA